MKRHLLIPALLLLLATRARAAVDVVNGPMIGHVTDSSARIWLQLSTSAHVVIHALDLHSREVAAVGADVEGPSPFIFDTPIAGLQPNTSYHIELTIDGKKVELTQDLTLTTTPPPGDIATLSVAFGSGLNPKNNASALVKSVGLTHPRAFLFLGDCGLLPAEDSAFPEKHRDAFRMISDFHKATRATPELQSLISTIPTYATWDDRDFGPARAGAAFAHSKESLVAFTSFWPNPDYGTPDVPGVFCTFSLADADFFLLDDRMYRTPAASTTAPAATAPAPPAMVGEGQLAWLKDKLKASTARFKIIACGSPLLRDQGPIPSWADFPDERAAFIRWLFDNKITGVVFISGGSQFGELTARKPDPAKPGEYPLFDLTSSALSTDIAPESDRNAPNAGRLALFADHNFGELELGGPRTKRFLTLRLHDATGKTKIERVIFADELK